MPVEKGRFVNKPHNYLGGGSAQLFRGGLREHFHFFFFLVADPISFFFLVADPHVLFFSCLSGLLACWLAGLLACWLAALLACWLACWLLACWLAGLLACWLACWGPDPRICPIPYIKIGFATVWEGPWD